MANCTDPNRPCALYKITNTVNGLAYYGISVRPNNRWNEHKRKARQGKKDCPKLYNSMRAHHVDNFDFQIIVWCKNTVIACMMERVNRAMGLAELNCTDGGEGTWGYKPSPETIAKQVKARTGSKRSPETRQRMSEAQKGIPKSEETKEKISQTLLGRAPPNKGKPMSEASRLKVSKSKTGVSTGSRSEEAKKSISEGRYRMYNRIDLLTVLSLRSLRLESNSEVIRVKVPSPKAGKPGNIYTDEMKKAQSERLLAFHAKKRAEKEKV